jgi:hypothetical protein
MTGADFTAACFWPLAVIFALLLKLVREPDVWRWIARIAGAVGVLYCVLWLFYGETSLVSVVDFYLFVVISGIGLVWFGIAKLRHPTRDSKQQWRAGLGILFGALFALGFGLILLGDFTQPRIVLEGRVANLRKQGYRYTSYYADIAGRTVKVMIPIYERLKFMPVVRVEVGYGSKYVYKIEYLAN